MYNDSNCFSWLEIIKYKNVENVVKTVKKKKVKLKKTPTVY